MGRYSNNKASGLKMRWVSIVYPSHQGQSVTSLQVPTVHAYTDTQTAHTHICTQTQACAHTHADTHMHMHTGTACAHAHAISVCFLLVEEGLELLFGVLSVTDSQTIPGSATQRQSNNSQAEANMKMVCLVFSSTTLRGCISLDTFISGYLKADFGEITKAVITFAEKCVLYPSHSSAAAIFLFVTAPRPLINDWRLTATLY